MSKILHLINTILVCIFITACSVPKQTTPNTVIEEKKIANTEVSTESDTVWDLNNKATIDYQYISFILALQNNDSSVANTYARLLRASTPSEMIFIELASFYLIEGNKEASIETLKEGMQLYPNNFEILTLWIDSIENKKKATQVLEQFIERNPNNKEARLKLYSLYYELREYRSILNTAEHVHKKEYFFMDDFYSGLAWNMLSNREKAIYYFKQCLSKEPTFIEGWFELGLLYENIHDYTLAQKVYSEGLSKNPNYPELWTRLIAINITLNKPRTALEYVRQGPQSKLFLLSAITIFIENGYYTQAIQILQMLEKQYPDAKEVHFYYAFLFIERETNFQKALWHLEQIPTNHSLYPKAVQLKVTLFQSRKELNKAIEVAKKAKDTMPELVEFWDIYGQTLLTTKEYEKAIAVYNEGLEHFPDSITLLYGLASVYNEEENIPKAMSLMEKIIELDNDNILALNYIGYTLTEKNEDLSRAKMLLEKAFFLDNDNVSVLDSLAWLYYKQKRYYDAMNLLKKAKEIGINDPVIWEHYAEVAVHLGLKQEAIHAYKKVLEYNPKHSKAKNYLRK